MHVSQQDFQFMVEDITSDLICMLVEKQHCTVQQAVDKIYNSHTYNALVRPETGLYAQSSGYVFEYLQNEIG